MTWRSEGLKLMSQSFPTFLGFQGLSVGSLIYLACQEQDT